MVSSVGLELKFSQFFFWPSVIKFILYTCFACEWWIVNICLDRLDNLLGNIDWKDLSRGKKSRSNFVVVAVCTLVVLRRNTVRFKPGRSFDMALKEIHLLSLNFAAEYRWMLESVKSEDASNGELGEIFPKQKAKEYVPNLLKGGTDQFKAKLRFFENNCARLAALDK